LPFGESWGGDLVDGRKLADELPMIVHEFLRGVQLVAEAGWMTEKTLSSQPAAISFRWLAVGRRIAYHDHLLNSKS